MESNHFLHTKDRMCEVMRSCKVGVFYTKYVGIKPTKTRHDLIERFH